MDAAAFITGSVAGALLATVIFYIWLIIDLTKLNTRIVNTFRERLTEIEEERDCSTCKYVNRRVSEEPCLSCDDEKADKWEAKE